MMGSFFKPLRRKLGVVTLVMSLGFMAGWIRSQKVGDVVECPGDVSLLIFASGCGHIELQLVRTVSVAASRNTDSEVMWALHEIALDIGSTISWHDGVREYFVESGTVEIQSGRGSGNRWVNVRVPRENGGSTHETSVPTANRRSFQRYVTNPAIDIERFKDVRAVHVWQYWGIKSASRRLTFTFSDPSPGETCITAINFWVIPYSSLVIPLTLLSAWLLLSKSRVISKG